MVLRADSVEKKSRVSASNLFLVFGLVSVLETIWLKVVSKSVGKMMEVSWCHIGLMGGWKWGFQLHYWYFVYIFSG